MRISLLFLLSAILICSCRKALEVISPNNLSILIRLQFDNNASLIDEFFRNERIALTAEELQTKRSQHGERDLFLKHMLELTQPAYGEVVMSSTIPASFKFVPTSNRAAQKMLKHLLPFPSGYTGANPGSGALDNFANEILDSINAKGGGKHIVIESYAYVGSASNALPSESFSLNFDVIKTNYQKMLQIISTTTNTAALDDGINEILSTASPQEGVLIGLLLPAVQKVRKETPYDDLMNQYFNMSPTERTTWDRDVRLAVFLCAYDFIISQEYNPKDEFTTSVEVNKQICDGVSVLAWARVEGSNNWKLLVCHFFIHKLKWYYEL
jgi:hypothetical protein